MSIFKTGNNPNLWVPCDELYDPWKIDINCTDPFPPSTAPSSSSSPTSSSAPTPGIDCSCGVGEFKFHLELKTDQRPEETSWQIEDGNGDILHFVNRGGYNENLEIFNHDYCLPVGCYDFVINDSIGDGICCFRGNYVGLDDDYFDPYRGYYKASLYGWKEVFNGGDFGFQAIEHFCGEDVCPFATHYPSLVPTSSSAPTTIPDCSCGIGEFKFELELRTDWFPWQTSWQIEDGNGEILHSGSGYTWDEHLTTFNYEYCLLVGCYDFVIDDSFGDGICCMSNFIDDVYYDDIDGYYKASVYGRKEVFNGGEFGSQAIEHFCGEDLCPFATHYPSLVPTSSSAPTTTPDCSCGVGEFKFELELKTDEYPTETSWQIEDGNGDIIVSESGYTEQLTIFNYEYCLPVGCYDFVIDDSAGDGLCCGFGAGYYKANLYGWKEVFNGGEFGSQAIEHFCGEDVCHIDASKSQFVSFSSLEQNNSPTTVPTTASLNIETLTSTVLKYFESIVTFFKNLLPF